MKKHIFPICLALLIMLTALAPLSVSANTTYIFDQTGTTIPQASIDRLNEQAQNASRECGISICFLLINDSGGQGLKTYANTFYKDHIGAEDGVLLTVSNEENAWCIDSYGKAADIVTEGQKENLWNYYQNTKTYEDGIQSYITQAARLFNTTSGATTPRVVDNAGLLTEEERQTLTAKLDEISMRQACDVVVVSVTDLGAKTAQEYADDFFDYNHYGIGPNHDGILLLVCPSTGEGHITTTGFGITAVTDYGRDYIIGEIRSLLSGGDYVNAFTIYADLCDEFISEAKAGTPYDVGNKVFTPPSLIALAACIAAGLFVAFAVTAALKKQLKSVEMQRAAGAYERPGSLNVTNAQDIFLYLTVTKVKRAENNSSGGSSTHRSSSGSFHGGGSFGF